ncbi:degenerin mec-10-like [Galendromus occidentalis]|uniref:Degenerin mec-10-like n=1 Tax=Galendromus occidentalis TaxID=34638 RepID=A0AAJ6QWN7_9ACAR|nr:degenerin mec-10-like [Galendromus occidentalis]
MIHDRSRLPDVNSDGVYIPVGMTTYVGFSMKKVNLLGKPFDSNCHTSWPKGEPYNAFLAKDDKYSEQACRKVCLHYNIMKECECLDLYKGVDYQQMLDSDAICVDEVSKRCREKKIEDPESTMKVCNCPKRCEDVQITTTVSQMAWNTRIIGVNPTAMTTANLVLYADGFAISNIIESQEITATAALSTVGGFMNMFTGASFLLIYEAISILAIWLYKVFTMKPSHDLGTMDY